MNTLDFISTILFVLVLIGSRVPRNRGFHLDIAPGVNALLLSILSHNTTHGITYILEVQNNRFF